MTSDPHAKGAVLRAGVALNKASLAVVLLHGRGASAEDILGLADSFDLEQVTYLAPQAAGHAWYPLSFMAPREGNEPYLSSALAKVAAIVGAIEQAGIERRRIVIAGFSQGACLATEFVYRNPARYGGLIAFTGGMVGPPGCLPDPAQVHGTDFAGMPAFFGNGDFDPHVPWARVEESGLILQALGADVTAMRYRGRPHTIGADEIDRARALLQEAQS